MYMNLHVTTCTIHVPTCNMYVRIVHVHCTIQNKPFWLRHVLKCRATLL